MKQKYNDKYLQKLWRKAVLIKNNNQCVFCGNKNINQLQCHHWIKRRITILRNDWRNGFPLCSKCHEIAHTKLGEQKLIKIMGEDRFNYLVEFEKYTLKDYLISMKMCRLEFDKMIIKELKNIIKIN